MSRSSASRSLYLWIACFAILMNTLAPSVSHALASRRGDAATWEICRADGTAVSARGQGELLAVGASVPLAKKLPQSRMGMMDDCGYCLPHAGSYALAPGAITGIGDFSGHELRPFLFYRAPQPLLALSAAPARGPPAIA